MPKYTIRINDDSNQEYVIKDGFTYEDVLNETLDSAKIIFETLGEIDIESFDDITIFDDSLEPIMVNKEMLVDKGINEIAYYTPTQGIEYNIDTFSKTKWLERFTCPNLAITKVKKVQTVNLTGQINVSGCKNDYGGKTKIPLSEGQSDVVYNSISISLVFPTETNYANLGLRFSDGEINFFIGDNSDYDLIVDGVIDYDVNVSEIVYEGKTVWHYIEKYCELYLPKVHVAGIPNMTFESRYKIASRVQSKFENIICPEFQWNTPTLREVLTDLMSTANCIPVINAYNQIDYLDLTQIGNEINTDYIDRIRSTFVSSDYCNELTMPLKNSIGRSRTRIVEYTSLRSLSGELTTENAVLITQHPIYNIVKLEICYYDSVVNNSGYYIVDDITKRVVEKRMWDTFGVAYYFDSADKDTLKATHVYYERGNNVIKGWGDIYTMGLYYPSVGISWPILVWLMRSIVPFPDQIPFQDMDLRDHFMFKIEYETITEHALHVGKYLPSKHYGNRIFDNQSNSYVDVEHQSMFEYFKVNRLGNKVRTMYAIYENETQIPHLGDYLTINNEKNILFNRKIQYYDNEIVFEGQLIANYVLKDYFTGVSAKKRSWAIAEGKEALDRKDIYKYYLEASLINKNDNASVGIVAYSVLLSAFGTYQRGNSIKWALAKTTDKNLINYPSSNDEAYAIEIINEIAGNSIIFSFAFGDNFSIGKYTKIEDNVHYCNDYPYVNDEGEFDNMEFSLVSEINPSDGDFVWPNDDEVITDTLRDQMKAKGMIKNLVKISAATKVIEFPNNINVYKDNREIISGVVQFELCSDTPNIVVKNLLWKLSSLFNNESYTPTFKIFMSATETYDLTDEIGKGTNVGDESDITVTSNQISIANINQECVSWAICDSDNNIVIAVNSNDKEIYLNFLSTRDRNIYHPTTRKVVGHLDN